MTVYNGDLNFVHDARGQGSRNTSREIGRGYDSGETVYDCGDPYEAYCLSHDEKILKQCPHADFFVGAFQVVSSAVYRWTASLTLPIPRPDRFCQNQGPAWLWQCCRVVSVSRTDCERDLHPSKVVR